MSATIHSFEGVEIVVPPGRGFPLTAQRSSQIEMIWSARADGDLGLAAALVTWVEDQLGTTDFDRVAARTPPGAIVGNFVPVSLGATKAEGLRHLKYGQRSAMREDRRRIASLIHRDPDVAEEVARALDEAELERTKATTAQKAKKAAETVLERKALGQQVKAHLRRARELVSWAEGKHRQAVERAARETFDQERKRQAEVRGERTLRGVAEVFVRGERQIGDDLTVPVQRKETVERVYQETGLDSLYRSRAPLTKLQFDAGMKYRELFELSEPGIMAPSGSGGARPDQVLSYDEARVWARDQLERINHAVSAKVGDKGLLALIEVAGKGRFIANLASSGSGQVAYRVALKRALNVTADVLRL